ncbi:MAG: heme exporter protein CcmB [Candidatus Bathyarchaeota archaeon]|nr:heme exporter protein CcmB [Candidatus Bathyarchaeota archaeon]
MSDENPLSIALKLAKKDLTVELRRPHEILSIIAFTLSSIIVSSFSWRTIIHLDPLVISSALWIIVYFASILVLTTSFAREVDRGTIDGLRSLPCPPYAVLAGKMIYGMVTLIIVLVSLIASSILFLNLDASIIPTLLMVFILGVIDFALMGSMMSAVLMYSEGKNLLLAFLFFPVSVPILLPGIQAGAKILAGEGLAFIMPEIKLLLAFMLGVIAVSMTLFQEIFLE